VEIMMMSFAWNWRMVRSYRNYALKARRMRDSTHFRMGAAGSWESRHGNGMITPAPDAQGAHGTEGLGGCRTGARANHPLADHAGPKESHQNRDGR
jgi:hypothetical protein